MIEVVTVADANPMIFDVTVSDATGKTRHRVTMTRSVFAILSERRHTAEDCVEAAFRFLLDREPKEAILQRFDITRIGSYFPDFEEEFHRYLD